MRPLTLSLLFAGLCGLNSANASVAQAPVFLFDKEGNPRCHIAGTGEHDDYLLSERLAEFVKNAPEDIRPMAQELADLRECDENDALYAGVELNPEEIRAAELVPSTKALMAGGVYVVSLLSACQFGSWGKKYIGEAFLGRLVGAMAYNLATFKAAQYFHPIPMVVNFVGSLAIAVFYLDCHDGKTMFY